ncbi:MAG TPA: zf-HC2 domain-containing protein [Mycobacteriales bacterium]|nr:zf-HC2 domain-containing protein [Mycobacteriales bacterium]
MNDEYATWDAAYVLGALTPQERADFERHLATCPQCREAVQSLAGMPGLLASTSAPPPPSEPPPTILPKLLTEVRRRRRRTRTAFTATALAAAAAVVAVLVLAVGAVGTNSSDQPATQAMEQTVPSPLNADAALVSAPWGTKIDVKCKYRKIGEAYTPRLYRLQVNDTSGRREEVATWDAIPGETMKIEGVTRLSRADISSIEISTDSGKPILRLRM